MAKAATAARELEEVVALGKARRAQHAADLDRLHAEAEAARGDRADMETAYEVLKASNDGAWREVCLRGRAPPLLLPRSHCVYVWCVCWEGVAGGFGRCREAGATVSTRNMLARTPSVCFGVCVVRWG